MSPLHDLGIGFILDDRGRIVSTREPEPRSGPRFILIRDASRCTWALHAEVSDEVAAKVTALAADEPPEPDPRVQPRHERAYLELLGGHAESGPNFVFPDGELVCDHDISIIDQLAPLERHFTGWTASELPERSPIMAIVVDGAPVSVCFCSRLADRAAAAGVDTAAAFRQRGFAAAVTAAWATAIRASGRVPLYSTTWDNAGSLGVARKLGLVCTTSFWNVA